MKGNTTNKLQDIYKGIDFLLENLDSILQQKNQIENCKLDKKVLSEICSDENFNSRLELLYNYFVDLFKAFKEQEVQFIRSNKENERISSLMERNERNKEEEKEEYKNKIVSELLNIVDGCTGLKTTIETKNVTNILKNYDAIERKIDAMLVKLDVEIIDCKINDKFDSELHEILFTENCEDEETDNTIKQVLKHGYRSKKNNKRVLRPALVVMHVLKK